MSADTEQCCPNCSGTLVGYKCKLVCERCGYLESCSDLEPAPPLPEPVQ